MRFLQIVAFIVTALVCALIPARAEKRVALVIGNGAYVHADRLANPVNDARGVRDALATLKFDIVYGEDLDGQALRGKIGEFADHVADADVALVYYAGHGATFGDTPYVVPVDAAFASLGRVAYELVPVETLIGELRQAKGVRIAILDACRDNGAERELKRQVAARGGPVTRGLAPMKNPDGLIIAYATQYMATAADDAGTGGGLFSSGSSSAGHSPFTAALLHNIATPGLDVTEMFRQVGRDVDAATGGKQRPEISISMYDRYALAPSGGPPSIEPPPAGGQTTTVTPPPGSALFSEAAQVWATVKNTTDIADIDRFLQHYRAVPFYGDEARTRRAELQKLASLTPPPRRDGVPLTADQVRGLKRGETFRECENCPEMVVVPAGSFTMGSPDGEKDRGSDEGPQHVVTIHQPFAVGKFHVTVAQFDAFVRETGYSASTTCFKWPSGPINGSWRDPGFTQEGSHPVVCISRNDAHAYVAWLAKKAGRPYRLLSEAEFEYAARGRTSPGSYSRFWFGDSENDLCKYGNGADQKMRDDIQTVSWGVTCNDGHAYTSPVGSYRPNAFGLYDMTGNAWQWTEDCYHKTYTDAPSDGSPWTTACDESARVLRGGAWNFDPPKLRAAKRTWNTGEVHDSGFRVARTLTP